jgi:hypothetical protein
MYTANHLSEEQLPKCEEYKRERGLSMALIRYPDGSGLWRARIYYGPTVDYPEDRFGSFDTFMEYCRANYELQAIEQMTFEQHGEPQEPDWEELREKAIEYTEAKRKAEEANHLYEKAVVHMEKIRKSKWIIPGLIRRP